MAYHNLSSDSGSTPEQRVAEAERILGIIGDDEPLTPKEMDFIIDMHLAVDKGGPISTKQLFWLRDIKAKYCE